MKWRNNKKESEVEFRFSNMTFDPNEQDEDDYSWISTKDEHTPGVSIVQDGTTVGCINPGYESSKSSSWQRRSTHPSSYRTPTMSFDDLVSPNKPRMSLNDEQHSSVDFQKDKT